MHFLIFPSFPDPSTSSFPFSSFSLWFLNFLFLITSSSDVWFLIRLILWRTHSIDFLEIALDNQIRYFLLHIFHRIMWGSMRENWYFPWPVCTFIGALRPAMRLVSWLLCFIPQNFQHLLRINFCMQSKITWKITWKTEKCMKTSACPILPC